MHQGSTRLGQTGLNEGNDVLGGAAGKKYFGDARFFEGDNVRLRNDAAEEDDDVVHAFFAQQFHELRADRIVRSGKDGEANNVDVFLDGREAIISGVWRRPV
jgi:hypothetical protein